MAVQTYIQGDSSVNIARSVEEAVASGRAGAGEQLPPVRTLAESLGVAPATVAAAYRVLRERGVIVSDGRRGTRIRHASPIASRAEAAMPENVRDLSQGNPDPALLPDLAAAIARAPVEQRLYGEELNDSRLLELARAQFEADGIPAQHVAVVSGALDGIERVLREHLRAGDRVAVEDPCFTGVLDLLNALSLVPVPIAVDDEGPLPRDLQKMLTSTIRALIVTPRAQNPTGAAFSERRWRQLRTMVSKLPDLLVVEDDHAGPIAGAPYRTLATATRERWAVVRSVSKSLGPDLRVAVLSTDARTHVRVEGRQNLGIRWVSHILQQLVIGLWSDRTVQRQLARAEKTYSERRTALIRALAEHDIEAHGASGLNVWIPVPEEARVVQALINAGWGVNAGERYRLRCGPGIRVTISTLTPSEAVRFAADLAAVLRPARRTALA